MSIQIFQYLKRKPQFIDSIPKDLRCHLCDNIFVNAQFLPCGCEFCQECLESYFENQEKHCPRNDELFHTESNLFEFTRDSSISNLTNCKIKKLKVKCQNCEEIKSVEDMSKHFFDVCIKSNSKCLFFNVGCNKTIEAKGLSRHMIDDITNHNQIVMDTINNLINEQRSIKVKLSDCRMEINSLKEENNQFKDELSDCRMEINSLKEENNQLKTQKEELGNRIHQISEQISEIDTNSNNNLQGNDSTENGNIMMKITNIETNLVCYQSQLKLTNDLIWNEFDLANQYIWTVSNLPGLRGQKRAFYSDTFNTNKTGYKMRLVLDTITPNNIGLYFQIVPGLFDDSLEWPMPRRVKLSIINQETGTDEFNNIFDNLGHLSFMKPGVGPNQPFGIQKFAKWNKLLHCSLMCNGQVKIRCVTQPLHLD